MARVETIVIEPGNHESPDGTVKATPQRIRHWINQFHQMRRAGLQIPVPWGHHSKALPEGSDEAIFAASRYNAGYIDKLALTQQGGLAAGFELPALHYDQNSGCVVDPKEKTAIREVSLGIAKKFKDGKGRVWNDVIVHCALVPLPVMGAQQGFTGLATKTHAEGLTCFSLAKRKWTLAARAQMADEYDDEDDSELEEAQPSADAGADGAPAPEMPPEQPGDQPPAEPAADAGAQANAVQALEQLKPLLEQHGIKLGEGTTPENLIEHLTVAMTALTGVLKPEGESPEGEMPPETGPVNEEQPDAMMMSLPANVRQTPAVQKLSLSIQRQNEELAQMRAEKAERRARGVQRRIERLKAGGIPKAVADKLDEHFGSNAEVICMSLTQRPSSEDSIAYLAKLSLLADLEPALITGKTLKRKLTGDGVTVLKTPMEAPKNDALTDKMVAKATGKA